MKIGRARFGPWIGILRPRGLRRVLGGALVYLVLGGIYAQWGLGHLAAPLAWLAALRLWDYGVAALFLMVVQSLVLDRILQAIVRR